MKKEKANFENYIRYRVRNIYENFKYYSRTIDYFQ